MTIKKFPSFIIFGSPDIGKNEIDAVVSVLQSNWIGFGPKCIEFQNAFSKYKDVKNSIAVNSATAALHLSLKALNLKKGDEVITTANTFCATVNSIIHAGGKPVLVDIDRKTLNIDSSLIEERITENTKAILPVHFGGLSCDMTSIEKIAKKYNLKIVEDCAHAIETVFKGRPAGTIGEFGCFSFYVTKNIVTAEGGMIITNNNKQAERVKIMSLHGMDRDAWKRFGPDGYKHYDVVDVGFKYNMTDIQAAMGVEQLKTVNKKWGRRKKIFEYYSDQLSATNIVLPLDELDLNSRHGYHLYPVRINIKDNPRARDEFIQKMIEFNIGTGVHYQSLPTYSIYKKLYKWKPKDFPEATSYGRETVSIPLSSKLSDLEVQYIVDVIKRIA